jgi:hypothetical protein
MVAIAEKVLVQRNGDKFRIEVPLFGIRNTLDIDELDDELDYCGEWMDEATFRELARKVNAARNEWLRSKWTEANKKEQAEYILGFGMIVTATLLVGFVLWIGG